MSASFLDYDFALRSSSLHFQKPDNRRCLSAKQPRQLISPPCCQARVERIKLHSGYYATATALSISEAARSSSRCLILMGEELPPRPTSSRSSTRSPRSLPVFHPDGADPVSLDDDELDDDNMMIVSNKRSVCLQTKDDVITFESFKVPKPPEPKPPDNKAGEAKRLKKSDVIDLSLAAILSTLGPRMPRPAEDLEPLWRKPADKQRSDGRSKVAIDFPEDEVVLDKTTILANMGRSIYSMSAKLKEQLTKPEDYKFISRFAQILHTERKTMDMEGQTWQDMPLGDHLEEKGERAPPPLRSGRKSAPLLNKRQKQQQQQQLQLDDGASKSQPTTANSKTRRSGKPSTPVDTLLRTSSPAVMWHKHHRSKTPSQNDEDKDDSKDTTFKTIMCG